MTLTEQIITIAILSIATILTRFIPFIVFSEKKETPEFIKFLGKYLPPAVFGMLIIYCLKNISFKIPSNYLPSLISIVIIILIHLYKKNLLLSITIGTILYMILIRVII